MAIIDLRFNSTEGAFDMNVKDITLEWIVLSDSIQDFAWAVAVQGTVSPETSLVDSFGMPTGWHPPGTPYRFGNETIPDSYAGTLEVTNRTIIRGKGDFEIGPGWVIVLRGNDNPVIKYNVKQRYSADNNKRPGEEPAEDDKFNISVSFEYEEEPFEFDAVTHRPVLNSAGQRFNPPAITRRKIPVISMTRTEYGNPVAKALAFSNTVDGQFLIDTIVPSFDGRAWTVTYNIKYKSEGWSTILMDRGYFWRHPDTGQLLPILNYDGTPVSAPVRLNGRGLPVPDESDNVYNVGPFHKYPFSTLAVLQIPNPMSIVTLPPGY